VNQTKKYNTLSGVALLEYEMLEELSHDNFYHIFIDDGCEGINYLVRAEQDLLEFDDPVQLQDLAIRQFYQGNIPEDGADFEIQDIEIQQLNRYPIRIIKV